MTTPDRPTYVRVTGHSNAVGFFKVGRVYHVWSWYDDAPVVRCDDGYLLPLAPSGVVWSKFYPTWDPCEGPAGKEDPS